LSAVTVDPVRSPSTDISIRTSPLLSVTVCGALGVKLGAPSPPVVVARLLTITWVLSCCAVIAIEPGRMPNPGKFQVCQAGTT
jgi:hypothetical protein